MALRREKPFTRWCHLIALGTDQPPNKASLRSAQCRPRRAQTVSPCERITTMAENKTKPTGSSVTAFLNKIKDRQLRDDCFVILEMMQKVSNSEPVMWGSAIIGFGTYHYLYY